MPAHLRLITGNRGKRPIKKGVEVAEALPDAPQFLSAEAKAEWARLAPQLSVLGLLTALDVGVLAAYCQSFAIWKQATESLADGSLTAKSAKGNDMSNLMLGITRRAAQDMARYASEFGLTPVARMRLAVPPRDSDPTDKYFS